MRRLVRPRAVSRSRPKHAGPKPVLRVEVLESRLAPAMVAVNATANVHPIDPNIYGTAFATTAQLNDLNMPLNRNGGNASDTYSYAQDATNRGSDWFFESIGWGSGNGEGMDDWINETLAGGAQPSITLNLFDWAREERGQFDPRQLPGQRVRSAAGRRPVAPQPGQRRPHQRQQRHRQRSEHRLRPQQPGDRAGLDQHLIDTFGNSQNGGVKYYTLGNEPGLWNHTHRDIHPDGNTLTELRDRVIAYASMVKSLDPDAKILGFEEWGWTNYFISGADSAAQNWGATYNGLNAQAWLLDQMRQHRTSPPASDCSTTSRCTSIRRAGSSADDVSTNMQLLRNRSTRSLWDPNYVDESWIASTGINGGRVNLINLMKNWVNTYYPGTKIGITEYNWGAEGNMNGATTQADIWGIFGREGLDLANRWTTPATDSPTYLAMKMYRNYDDDGSAFGETSVQASVANPDQVSAFASIRASDGALTVMVVNKNLFNAGNPGATTPITINLDNFPAGVSAERWQLAAINPSNQNSAAITHLSDATISGNSLTVTVPMQSVTLFVIPAASPSAPAAPTGVSAVGGDGRVTLSWNAVSGATSYKVYRGTASGSTNLLQSGVTTSTFLDTGVTNGTTYFYTVSAVNGVGESPRSQEVSATPQVAAPAAPANLQVTAVWPSQIELTWNDNSSTETGFVVQYATDGAFTSGLTTVTTSANATSYRATGLSAGTTYWFRVRASNAGGQSANSNVTSATTILFAGDGNGLAATYFNNANFTGTTVARTDATINFNWATGSPASGIAKNTFSVRWLGQIQAMETGAYRFRTLSDEGVKLWVNGKLLVNHWAAHTLRVDTSAAISLTAGAKYDIRMLHHDNTGAAVARLLWRRPGQTTFSNVPESQLFVPGDGLAASYFDNIDLTGPSISRIDSTINFNWDTNSPHAAIAPDTFSVRWTGQIQATESGTYTIRTYSDDGVRLWLNGQEIIDNWTDHGPVHDTGTITLQAGQKYDVVLEYYDNTNAAVLQLEWLRPGSTAFEIIPKSKLYSGSA